MAYEHMMKAFLDRLSTAPDGLPMPKRRQMNLSRAVKYLEYAGLVKVKAVFGVGVIVCITEAGRDRVRNEANEAATARTRRT